MVLIRAAMKGRTPDREAEPEPQQADVDLMERLRQSLQGVGAARKKPGRATKTSARGTKKRAA